MTVLIRFDSKWLEETGAAGRKILRGLEKWSRALEEVKLLSATPSTLAFEMAPARKPGFREALLRELREVHGISAPEKIFAFGGGEAEAASASPAVTVEEAAPANPGRTVEPGEANASAQEEVSAEDASAQVLEEVLASVPAKFSRDISDVFREIAAVAPMLRQMDVVASFWRQNILIAIDDGYGLSDFLKALGKLLAAQGLAEPLDERSVREQRLSFDENPNDPFRAWTEAVEKAMDLERSNEKRPGSRPILCLDIGAWQDRLQEPRVKDALRKLNAHSGNFLVVFRVPFVETHVFKKVESVLADILNVRSVVVPPTSVEHLTAYAREELGKRAFTLETSAVGTFEQWILEERRDNSFFGFKTLDKMVNRVIYEKALSCAKSGTADRSVAAADLESFLHLSAVGTTDPYAELDGLIGLAEVKHRIREVVALVKAAMKTPGKGRKAKRPAIHMLFTGNPGTGKTTVARLVAQILKHEGVLRKGHLLEVSGRDLCGEYVGQTAPKTSAICRDAYGSVLFIDEAYSLFRGDGSDRDYGREALDTLIAEMENHRDDLCVILAGYPGEMRTMLGGNAGLESRIPYQVEFPNYSRAELAEIFARMVDGSFDYEQELIPAVEEYFNALPEEVVSSREFSNARFVRNLYERTWGKAAYRSRLDEGEVKLLKVDLLGATEEREFKQLLERKNVSRPIGFV